MTGYFSAFILIVLFRMYSACVVCDTEFTATLLCVKTTRINEVNSTQQIFARLVCVRIPFPYVTHVLQILSAHDCSHQHRMSFNLKSKLAQTIASENEANEIKFAPKRFLPITWRGWLSINSFNEFHVLQYQSTYILLYKRVA